MQVIMSCCKVVSHQTPAKTCRLESLSAFHGVVCESLCLSVVVFFPSISNLA